MPANQVLADNMAGRQLWYTARLIAGGPRQMRIVAYIMQSLTKLRSADMISYMTWYSPGCYPSSFTLYLKFCPLYYLLNIPIMSWIHNVTNPLNRATSPCRQIVRLKSEWKLTISYPSSLIFYSAIKLVRSRARVYGPCCRNLDAGYYSPHTRTSLHSCYLSLVYGTS